MPDRYDVIIIGAGPAGIFAALELTREPGRRVLIVEKGHAIAKRRCPARQTACVGCKTCDIMTGWGGAGAFSDGKLTLTTEVGGWLGDYVEREALEDLIDYSDRIWLEYGATTDVHGPDAETAERLCREATLAGMKLVPMPIRHLGTDRSPQVLDAMRDRARAPRRGRAHRGLGDAHRRRGRACRRRRARGRQCRARRRGDRCAGPRGRRLAHRAGSRARHRAHQQRGRHRRARRVPRRR